MKTYLLFISALTFPLLAQEAPRAQIVEEPLVADAGNDYFNRAKNIYDSANANKDPEIRRELFLRSSNIFSNYLEEFSNHTNTEAAWWYLGSSFYQSGLIDDARRCFSVLLNQYRQGKYAAAATYTLAADHFNRKEFTLAAPLFERFAENPQKPGDKSKGYILAAKCYLQMESRSNQALSNYRLVLEDAEGTAYHSEAQIESGKIHLKNGNFDRALPFFLSVADSDTTAIKLRGDAALHVGITAYKLNQLSQAETYLNWVLSTSGTEAFRPDAQLILMEMSFSQKNYKKVISLFEQSNELPSKEKNAQRLMITAKALMYEKNPNRASQLFRDIERLVDPENEIAFEAAYFRLHAFYQTEGKYVLEQIDGFLEIYEKPFKNDPRIHTAKLLKAETLFAEKNVKEAAAMYAKIDPNLLKEKNRIGFYYQKGWCLAEAGDADGAIRSFSQFIEKYPADDRHLTALIKRAQFYAILDDYAKSVLDYDKVIKTAEAPKDLISIAWLESARVRRSENQEEDSLKRYQSLLEKVPNLSKPIQAEANYWIGYGLLKKNDTLKAIPYLKKARELHRKAYAKHAGVSLAISYFGTQQLDPLSEEIHQAIQQDYIDHIPAQAVKWCGMQNFNAGAFSKSAETLETLAKYDEPRATEKEIWRYLGKSLLETKEPKKALIAINHLLEMESQPAWKADALVDRARAHFAMKDFEESRKASNEANELRPQGRTSAQLRLVSGDLYIIENQLGQAAADFLYVINFYEDQELKPLAISKYIGVLEKQGKTNETEEYKTKLQSEFPAWKVTE